MTAATVPASQLSPLPENLFPRQANSEDHVAALADALRAGATLPPVLVDDKRRIVDGYHRWRAHQVVYGPDAPVPCETKRYASEKDLFLDALRENAKHGLRFNSADRTRCSAIAHRLSVDGAALASSLSTTPDALEGASERSPASPPRGIPPEIRAQEATDRLLRLLGSGQLRQNAVALEKDLRRLVAAIDAYLERAEEFDEEAS